MTTKLFDANHVPASFEPEVVMVDAPKAREWLVKNVRNRPISTAAVNRYKADMESGLWRFAADPIRFDYQGNLIDGQHRLSAIASAKQGTALPMLVVYGLESEAQLVMDQGRKRDAGQQLAMLGYKHAPAIAAGARLLILWQSGNLFGDGAKTGRITAPMIQEWVIVHPELVRVVNDHPHFIKTLGARPSVTLAFLFKVAAQRKSLAIEFFGLLHDRSELPKGSPILALDNKFRDYDSSAATIEYQRDQLGYYLLAWNAWIDRRSLTKLQKPKGGWTSRNFPEPK